MCYNGCQYWERYSESCRKPRHAPCTDDIEEDEEDERPDNYDPDWEKFVD